MSRFQSALRFAVLPDTRQHKRLSVHSTFQSALRFAVLPDWFGLQMGGRGLVSIRFKVRGASRRILVWAKDHLEEFQSALRFAVLPDDRKETQGTRNLRFQSALRFAVLPDTRRAIMGDILLHLFQSALRFAVLPDSIPEVSPARRRFNPL